MKVVCLQISIKDTNQHVTFIIGKQCSLKCRVAYVHEQELREAVHMGLFDQCFWVTLNYIELYGDNMRTIKARPVHQYSMLSLNDFRIHHDFGHA